MNFLSSNYANYANYGSQINLLHSLFVGPLLVWTGYKLNTGTSLRNIEKIILLITGVSVLGYHGLKAFKKQQEGASVTEDYGFQVNMLHLFFIGPLVTWTAWKLYKGKRVTDLEKTTLLFLGAAALMYHFYGAYKTFSQKVE